MTAKPVARSMHAEQFASGDPVRRPRSPRIRRGLLAAATACVLAAPVLHAQALASAAPEKDLGDAGRLIIPSLNINEAELDDVLVALAQFSGLNIISGAKMKGNVSVYWQNVTVQEALEALLETNELGYIYKNGIVRVLPASKLGEDEVIHVTRVFKLNYLNAGEVAASLIDVSSDKGRIQVNQESNALVVTDKAERVAQIGKIVEEMDVRFLQVVIEAQLWEVSFGKDAKLGIDWSYLGSDPTDRFDINLGNANTSIVNQLLPGGSLQFGFVHDDSTFFGFVNALKQNSDINVLAHPYILARNNKEADIKLQDQLPFVETSISNGVITESVNFQEVGIRLTVTPHITNDEHVIMDILLSQRIPGPMIQLQNSTAFSVDERVETTTLIIPDHRTVVIGGLFDTNISYSQDKVPILGDLPLFGHFFRKRTESESRSDLMLCISPHILGDSIDLPPEVQHRLSRFGEERDTLARQLSEFQEKVESRKGGLKDKVLDETANNLGPILHGEKAVAVDPELLPANPNELVSDSETPDAGAEVSGDAAAEPAPETAPESAGEEAGEAGLETAE